MIAIMKSQSGDSCFKFCILLKMKAVRPLVTGTVDEWVRGLESEDPDLRALSLEQTRYVVATSLSFPNPFNWGFRNSPALFNPGTTERSYSLLGN